MCISRGDPRVRMLLGDQKLPSTEERIRKSRFVYMLYAEGRYLLFHTLTRELLVLPPRFIDYFEEERLFPASILIYQNHVFLSCFPLLFLILPKK